MAKVDEIIIEVEVNAGESAERLMAIQANIHKLKAENKELRSEQKMLNEELRINGTLTSDQAKRLKDISAEMAKNTADLKELTAAEKMYTAQLNVATQDDRKFGDSLVELAAQLTQLKQEYRGLTAAQRESEGGQKLLKQIQDLDKTMKDADETMGDWQRHVGHYQNALLGLNGNVMKISQLFAGGFKQSVAAAGQAVKSFGKMLLTTPVGWIAAAVAAVVAAFNKLKEAFKASDEAGTALSVAIAKLQPIVTAVNAVFVTLADTVAKVVGAVTGAASAIIGFLVPSFKEASKAAEELVNAEDKLQDRQREYTLASAERAKQIAELKKQERADENLTFQEREEIFQKIDELEKQDLAERVSIAKENARIIEERYKNEVNSSDEAKDRITEARAAVLKAETDYLTGTTRIAARAAQARKQEAAEAEAVAKKEEERRRAAHEAWKKQQEERKKALQVAQEEMRHLEDLENEFISDVSERMRKQIELQYKRQIEDLKERLKTEKNLTVEARESINRQIALLSSKMQKELMDYDAEQLKKRNETTLSERRKLENALNELENDEIKKRENAAKAAAEREIQDIRNRLETDAALTEEQRGILEKQIKAREEKLQQELDKIHQDAIRSRYSEDALAIENEYQERLNAIYGNAAKQAELEAERTSTLYRSLVEMDEESKAALYDSEEQYRSAVLAAENDMYEARTKSENALKQQSEEVAATMQSVTGALSSLYEAAAGDSEEYEQFKKAIAVVDATISLATTIAAATSASTSGDPYTMAIRIATNVAAVTAQFAAVIKAIKAATIPTAPSFEHGGIVPGTSYSGDKVVSRVNSREMVLTLQQQEHLFHMIQAGVPTVGIDYRQLAAAVREGVSALPAPVLDYSEFTQFGRRLALEDRKLKQM